MMTETLSKGQRARLQRDAAMLIQESRRLLRSANLRICASRARLHTSATSRDQIRLLALLD